MTAMNPTPKSVQRKNNTTSEIMTLTLPDIDSLSVREQVAQMVVVRASGYLFDHQIQYPQWEAPNAKLQSWLEMGVGGVILLGGSAAEIALRSQQLQTWAKIPLLIAADIEEGVGQRFSGATWFPPPMALSAIANTNTTLAEDYATKMGAITAQEALAIGINWVLAPVVDVNNNPNNPVINVRAFGETSDIVSRLTTAFIKGAKNYPVLTAAKHFPGHGDTTIDSHLDLPVLAHSPQRLAKIELPPFKSAIAAGVDAVMSAHLLIPSWDAKYPATLSQQIITQQLRKNLEFERLIVTDALIMGAIAKRYGIEAAAVLAVAAGVDILLMPPNPEAAIDAVCAAVESNRISSAQIRASVERIWQAKQRLTPTTPNINELAQPTALTLVDDILRETQVIHGAVPLQISAPHLRNLIVVDDLLTCEFLTPQASAIALPTQLGYTTELIDCHTPATATPANQPTLLQLFIRGNPFRGNAGSTQVAENLVKNLLQTDNLQALVIYGSPYTYQKFLQILPSEVPGIFSYGQMPSAQTTTLKILFGL